LVCESFLFPRSLAVLNATALLLQYASTPVDAASGYRDATFGLKGRVITDFSGASSQASKAVIQPDGRIVVVGRAGNELALARYKEDGSADKSFGKGGRLTTAISTDSWGTAVALQPDGKIVAAGTAGEDFALARYNPDGSLDSSFGVEGKVTTDFFGGSDSVAAILILPDGRILAGGTASTREVPAAFALARYDDQGGLDLAFGNSGKTTIEFFEQGDYAEALALQPDGKIIVGGSVALNGTGVYGVARLNSDGSLDLSFGSGGRVTTDFFGNGNVFETLVLQPDGKIIAAGQADSYDSINGLLERFGLVRYNADGSLDSGFGDGGKVVTAFSGMADFALALALQPDGKILAAGESIIPGTLNFSFAVAGYNPDGSLDEHFGTGGKLTDSFFTKQSFIIGVVFQPDGKAVAVGHSGKYARGFSNFAIARYSAGQIQ
jgi:uncharacterized delta-60 repeat protein